MLESIGFCFVTFILLVLYITWFFLKKSVGKDELKVRRLDNTIMKRENSIKELERLYIEKKNQIDRLIDDDIVCRHQLLQTTNLLRKKSDELYRVQEKLKKILKVEEEKKSKKPIEEESLNKNYIKISKDQFKQIEKRLKEYKSRIDILEDENSKLLAHRKLKKESNFLEDINLYISNVKETTLSNLFEKEQKLKQI
jgi:hypothetical protein